MGLSMIAISLPRPKAKAHNTNQGLGNSTYHAKTELNNCFIMHFHVSAESVCKQINVSETQQPTARQLVDNFILQSLLLTNGFQ